MAPHYQTTLCHISAWCEVGWIDIMAKISKERRMKIVKMSKNKSRLRNSEFQEAESQKSSRCFKALKVFCIDLYGIIFESYNSGWKLIRIAKAQPKKTARQHELKRFTAAKKLALTKKYLKATKQQLYRYLPPITKTIQIRRTRHAGHGWRSRDELISDVLLWTPSHGRAKAGWPARTYIQQLC